MEELIPYVQPIGVLTLVGICLFMGRMLNGRLNNKVTKNECHSAQKSVSKRIDDFQNHVDNRFDDIKDFIKKNGNSKY